MNTGPYTGLGMAGALAAAGGLVAILVGLYYEDRDRVFLGLGLGFLAAGLFGGAIHVRDWPNTVEGQTAAAWATIQYATARVPALATVDALATVKAQAAAAATAAGGE